MAVILETSIQRYTGLSGDTKPTGIKPGSYYWASDTNILYKTYDGTNWALQECISGIYTLTKEQVIDASLGAYSIGDVVGADDCCTTLAIPWIFDIRDAIAGFPIGGAVWIVGAALFNETENQAVQYDLLLFNATPTGELRDNAANTNPLKGDKASYSAPRISFPISTANGATVATTMGVTPNTSGNIPKIFRCAAADTKLYGVLVTNTAYTQTPGDIIQIKLHITPES